VKAVGTDYRTVKKALTQSSSRKSKVGPDIIDQFYCRDDNSRLTSGKKQCKKSRNGEVHQIRYLQASLSTLYHKFCSENGALISRSTFNHMRPFFVLKPQLNDREQCMCLQCSNLQVTLLPNSCYSLMQPELGSLTFSFLLMLSY
jgi:hypothetical protein